VEPVTYREPKRPGTDAEAATDDADKQDAAGDDTDPTGQADLSSFTE